MVTQHLTKNLNVGFPFNFFGHLYILAVIMLSHYNGTLLVMHYCPTLVENMSKLVLISDNAHTKMIYICLIYEEGYQCALFVNVLETDFHCRCDVT